MSMECPQSGTSNISEKEEIELCLSAATSVPGAFERLIKAFEPVVRKYILDQIEDLSQDELQDLLDRIFWTAEDRLTAKKSPSWAGARCVFPPRARYTPGMGFGAFLNEISNSILFEVSLCRLAEGKCGLNKEQDAARTNPAEVASEAFGELYRCYEHSLRGHVTGRLRIYLYGAAHHSLSLDDLVHDVFERALKNLKAGKYRLKYSFFVFLRNIAKYVILENVVPRHMDQAVRELLLPRDLKRIMKLELIRLAFLSESKPHQILALTCSAIKPSDGLHGDGEWWNMPFGRLLDSQEEALHGSVCTSKKPEPSRSPGRQRCLCRRYLYDGHPAVMDRIQTASVESSYDPVQVKRLHEMNVLTLSDASFEGVYRTGQPTPAGSREECAETWCLEAVQPVLRRLDGTVSASEVISVASESHRGHPGVNDLLALEHALLTEPAKRRLGGPTGCEGEWEGLCEHLRECTVCEGRLLAHLYLRGNFRLDKPLLSMPPHLPPGVRDYFREVSRTGFLSVRQGTEGARPAEAASGDDFRNEMEEIEQPHKIDKGVLREALALSIACGAKPHQILAFGYIRLLDYRPRELAGDGRMHLPMDELLPDFLEQFHEFAEVPFPMDVFRQRYCIPLLDRKLKSPLKIVYPEAEYRDLVRIAEANDREITGQNALADFISGDTKRKPENILVDWCDKVTRRMREIYEGERSPEDCKTERDS
jgi:hypothetical protein